MPEAKLDYTWEEAMRDWREYTLEFTIFVDWSPFIPAKTNCDPEDGHPAEDGDFEVTEVRLDGVEEVLADGTRVDRPEEYGFGEHRGYWKTRFTRDVEGTEQFRDWVGEKVDQEESGANEPEDDGR